MTATKSPLADSLDEIPELRPFPAAASQVMAACEREDVNAGQIAEIISCAPALSLKILRIANSPLYGYSGEIRSVDHAAVVLGLRKVKELAISSAVGEVFDSGDSETASLRQELWRHSLACGCLARVLSEYHDPVLPEEAFLAGLVHDVGKLVLFDHHPEEYVRITGHDLRSTVEREIETFGVDHASIGQRCGESWGLPFEIHEAICFHHEPAEATDAEELVSVVAAANLLTRIWMQDEPAEDNDLSEFVDVLGVDVTEDCLVEIREQAFEQTQAAFEAFK